MPSAARRAAVALLFALLSALGGAVARAAPGAHAAAAAPAGRAKAVPVSPLRVVAVNAFRPISFADENGAAVGVVEDYFELVRRALDLPLRDVRVMSANDAEQALRDGEADIVIGIVQSEERTQNGVFTAPVYSTGAAIVTRHGAPAAPSFSDLKGKTLALREHHFAIPMLRQHWPQVALLESGVDSRSVLKAVASRRADAALVSIDASRVWLAQPEFASLVVSGFPADIQYEFAFQLQPGLAELVPRFNEAIAQITTEQRSTILERWLANSLRVKASRQGIPLATAMFGAVALSAILILAFALARMRRAHRAERERGFTGGR